MKIPLRHIYSKYKYPPFDKDPSNNNIDNLEEVAESSNRIQVESKKEQTSFLPEEIKSNNEIKLTAEDEKHKPKEILNKVKSNNIDQENTPKLDKDRWESSSIEEDGIEKEQTSFFPKEIKPDNEIKLTTEDKKHQPEEILNKVINNDVDQENIPKLDKDRSGTFSIEEDGIENESDISSSVQLPQIGKEKEIKHEPDHGADISRMKSVSQSIDKLEVSRNNDESQEELPTRAVDEKPHLDIEENVHTYKMDDSKKTITSEETKLPDKIKPIPDKIYKKSSKNPFHILKEIRSQSFKEMSVKEKIGYITNYANLLRRVLVEIRDEKKNLHIGVFISYNNEDQTIQLLKTNNLKFTKIHLDDIDTLKIIRF